MKHRCMCGKPDYILEKGDVREYEFANPRDINSSEIYKHKMMRFFSRLQEPTLHFKSADRECERCGRPLCKDCQVQQLKTKGIKQTSLHFTWFEAEYVTRCSVCAKEAI